MKKFEIVIPKLKLTGNSYGRRDRLNCRKALVRGKTKKKIQMYSV